MTSITILWTTEPIMVELKDLLFSVISSLSQPTLLRRVTLLLESFTVILSPALLDLFSTSESNINFVTEFPLLMFFDILIFFPIILIIFV